MDFLPVVMGPTNMQELQPGDRLKGPGVVAPTVTTYSSPAGPAGIPYTDDIALIDGSSGLSAMNLPTASQYGRRVLEVSRIDNGGLPFSLDSYPGDTVNGVGPWTVSLFGFGSNPQSIRLACDGVSKWFVLSLY